VVDKVNGRTISRLADLDAALKEPQNGFHRIEFARGEGVQRILLDANEITQGTRRVLERYGIPAAKVFAE
jgi:hypothetical protein